MLIKCSFVIQGDAKVLKKHVRFWLLTMSKIMGLERNGITLVSVEQTEIKKTHQQFRKEQIEQMFKPYSSL